MSDTENDIVCQVCDQRLGKTRCHYGGVSCYSCRAFFRRNTQRAELPLCKGDGGCPITTTVRKQCAACRYQKCLSIGMRRELVLDDEEKKTRFRKFLSKKASESDSGPGSELGLGVRSEDLRRSAEEIFLSQSQCPEVKTEIPDDDSGLYHYGDCGRTSEYYEVSGVPGSEGGHTEGVEQPYENYIENFIKKESEEPDYYQARSESLVQINSEDIREIFSSGCGGYGVVGGVVGGGVVSGTSVIKHKQEASRISRLGGTWDHPTPPDPLKRKSVIVRAGTVKHSQPEPLEEPNINDVISSALSLFPDDIEMLRTLEADQTKDPLVKIVNCWNQAWNEVSHEEQVITEYLTFCRYRNKFPLKFYNNNVIRERCFKFLNSLEDYERLKSEERLMLVQRNQDNAEMLAYIHVFNQPTWQEELEFLFGAEDKQTWKFYNNEVAGVPLSTMITCMPISELKKLDIYRTFASCKPPDGLLADRIVFILTWILVNIELEDAESSEELVGFRSKIHSQLRCYLHQHRGHNVQSHLANIYNCIKVLPRLAEVFASMRVSSSG